MWQGFVQLALDGLWGKVKPISPLLVKRNPFPAGIRDATQTLTTNIRQVVVSK